MICTICKVQQVFFLDFGRGLGGHKEMVINCMNTHYMSVFTIKIYTIESVLYYAMHHSVHVLQVNKILTTK